MQKQINARLVQKNGFESDWLLATNFIPLRGEIIIYNAEADQNGNLLQIKDAPVTLPNGRTEPYTYARFKIGDGVTPINALPFEINVPSGSGLPEVTTEDNGSFLRVINGEWQIVQINVYDGSVV